MQYTSSTSRAFARILQNRPADGTVYTAQENCDFIDEMEQESQRAIDEDESDKTKRELMQVLLTWRNTWKSQFYLIKQLFQAPLKEVEFTLSPVVVTLYDRVEAQSARLARQRFLANALRITSSVDANLSSRVTLDQAQKEQGVVTVTASDYRL
ncbi:MAG: hypothetical protein Q9207_006337 [Kuettlingeria erythrocarpa]